MVIGFSVVTLQDIDECNNGSHSCDVNANCENTKNTYNSYLFSLILIIVPVRKDKRETDNHIKAQKMSLSNS